MRRLSAGVRGCPGSPVGGGQYGNMFNIPKNTRMVLPGSMYLLIFSHPSQPNGRGIYSYFKDNNICPAFIEAPSVTMDASDGAISWSCDYTPVCLAIRMSY